ncbi:hypothetical protein RHGRI_029854 [Rhododendron griersonianum]|uniref:Cytochrome P450 n=1 Tax=Rhododendron griersonianum TaxID=479676 RepID=A0AAV6ILV7_9ERIC|nr:hypothetical protein RHGRI_029854 [Rhododendron griersonianum]
MGHRRFQHFLEKNKQDKVDKGLIPVLEQICQLGLVMDLQDLLKRFTFDTTCILVNGYDPNSLSLEFPEVPFTKAMDDLEETILIRHVVPESFWKLQRWLVIGKEKKYSEAWVTIDRRDTVNSALTWLLWLVSTHPIVEARIREELEASILKEGNAWRFFNVEQVSKLVYLHSVICESLRLYPPVPFEEKEPHQSDILPSGHHVHPKLRLLFSIYAMGRMKFIWGEDCLEFKPERWITKQGMIRHEDCLEFKSERWITKQGTFKHEPSFKLFAFNARPRTCLGKDMVSLK